MATNTQTKLFRIASEINIGKEAIVEFLNSKGFQIENKPTAVLTDEMVEAVYDKFKKERKAAEKQREKVQKLKGTKKTVEKETIELKTTRIPEEVISEVEPETLSTSIQTEIIQEEIGPVQELVEEELIHSESIVNEESETIILEKTEIPTKTTEEAGKKYPSEKIKLEVELEQAKNTLSEEEILQYNISDESEVEYQEIEVEAIDDETEDILKIDGKIKILGRIDLDKEKKKREKIKPPAKIIDRKEKKLDTKKIDDLFNKKKKVVTDEVIDIEEIRKERTKKRKRKKNIREMINQQEVDKAIKETIAEMGDHYQTTKTKKRLKKKQERDEKELKLQQEREREEKILKLTEYVTTNDLANLMNVSANEIILKCLGLGLTVTINQRLDKDTIELIADDYGFEVQFIEQEIIQLQEDEEDPPETLQPRPPIVTIMGHVDHGKTSLLDYIRHSNVVAGEAGGITQHIGAYMVSLDNNKSITFLDTPGHEAFTAMRARGAQVTDIVVLIVAADDSVMPQTLEAISHALAANVPIIVAINKIDKPDARPDRIKQQLADHNILVEDWGGKYQCVEISAKQGTNVDTLLEKILLEAELLDLKANPNRRARGTIIESNMQKGLGAVATVIVQKGTLKIGDPFVAGSYCGRVRAMFDERNNKVEFAGPSTPVSVIGFDGLPEAGDILLVVNSDSEAKAIANQRQQLRREQELRQVKLTTLDEISRQIQLGGVKDLKLIIKGDVMGSIEALSDSLIKLSRDEVRVDILHRGVGPINESDVMLAKASGAIIIGFQVSPTPKARKLAENEKVEIRQYDIIYDCLNEIELALEGLLAPEIKEEITATVEIRKVFKISKVGNVAGCYVLDGTIHRNDKIRVLRDGLPLFTGNILSLKRNKDDVKEVMQGYECGIQINGFNDIQEGDIIEGFKVIEVKRKFD